MSVTPYVSGFPGKIGENHARIQKVFQRGSNFDVFFVDKIREEPNATICRPTSASQRNAIEMAFRWRADDGPTLNAGLVALCFSRGSGPVLLCPNPLSPPPPPPPLDPPMKVVTFCLKIKLTYNWLICFISSYSFRRCTLIST